MEAKQISVIIPIYNAEQYLGRCIESVINQTYRNLEVILVDDGSTDGSVDVCNKYKALDERIIVIRHQKNEGLVNARKTGAINSKGEYVYFTDSDDWLELDIIERLARYISKDVDMVTGAITFEDEGGNVVQISKDSFECKLYEMDEIRNSIIPQMIFSYKDNKQGIVASACNKLFRVQTIMRTIENIDERLTFGEDAALVYSFLSIADKLCITYEEGYHYIQYKKSMVHSYGTDSYERIYRLYNQLVSGISLQYEEKIDQIQKYVSVFLNEATKSVFNITNRLVVYVPPFEIIPQNSRIVVYGAGDAGRGYCGALAGGGYAKLVGWIDKYNFGDVWNGIEISPIHLIREMKYDYILIAITKNRIVEMIKNELELLGVDKDIILWKQPVCY